MTRRGWLGHSVTLCVLLCLGTLWGIPTSKRDLSVYSFPILIGRLPGLPNRKLHQPTL